MSIEHFIALYDRELNNVIQELNAYENDEDVWIVQKHIKNSAGNLCQHLVGNLKTFIGKEVGGFDYIRNRDAEFSERQFERDELLKLLNDTKLLVSQSLKKLDETSLSEPYPSSILTVADDQTIAFVLVHLLSHLSYHTGQINYHRRLIK